MAILEAGFLDRVEVREIWPDEAQNFTPWLAENLALLGEVLQLDLELEVREAPVGNYMSLDILATDGNGTRVAIENQLEKADHTHFGQLLTYAAWHDAGTLIWVTDNFRQEHSNALRWLNRWTRKRIDIYGVEVRVIPIGKSIRVPKFVPVVSPAAQPDEITVESPSTGLDSVYDKQGLFQLLVDKMRDKGFADTRKAGGWIQQFDSKSVPGLTYNAGIEYNPRVFMDMKDKRLKRALRGNEKQRKQLEKELGILGDEKVIMNWGRNKWNISVARKGPENHPIYSIYSDDEFEEIWDWMFDYLVRFEQVFDVRAREIMEYRGWAK